jgi:hypothetical protein
MPTGLHLVTHNLTPSPHQHSPAPIPLPTNPHPKLRRSPHFHLPPHIATLSSPQSHGRRGPPPATRQALQRIPDFAFRLIQLAAIPFDAIRGTPDGIFILRALKAEPIGRLLGNAIWDNNLLTNISQPRDSRRHARRQRANRAERDSQPRGCPKGDGPLRRDPRQCSGLQRLGLVAGHRTQKTTPDAPPIPDLLAQPRGVVSAGHREGTSQPACRRV